MKPSAYSAYPTMHLVPCMLMIMLVMRTPAAMGFQGHLTAPNYYYSSPTTGSTTTCTFSRDLRSRMGSTISNNKCEPRMIRNFTILKMSNSSQNENSKSPAGVAVAPSQKAYRISAMLHLLSSLTIFIMPNRMEPTLLHRYPASKVGGATGFALAAGISYILGNGGDPRSRDGRIPLGSSGTDTDIDTYPESSSNETTTNKKLHFGIMMFSFIGMLAVPGEASFHPSFQGAMGVFGIMSLARFMSAWVGFKGWLNCNGIESGSIFSGSVTNSRGIQIRDLVRECKRGVRETWFDVNDSDSDNMQIEQGKGKGAMLKRKKKNIFSLFYWCALVGMLNNSLSFYHAGKASTSIPFNKSIHISAIARLSLVSSIASTLRVAAWRGRLNEVPFVQLKYMLCAWAGLVGVASGFIDANLITFITQKAVYFMMFAWPIMYKGRGGDEMDVEDEIGTAGK